MERDLTRLCFYCKKDLMATIRQLSEKEYVKCPHCGNKIFVTESWPKTKFFDCISILKIKDSPQIGKMFVTAISDMGDY